MDRQGEPGRGYEAAAINLGMARAHTAARSIGLARGALQDSLVYAKERVQFVQPILAFQALRFKIATMATVLAAARHPLYHFCSELPSGRPARAQISLVHSFAS